MAKYCCVSLDLHPEAIPLTVMVEAKEPVDAYIETLKQGGDDIKGDLETEERIYFAENAKFDSHKEAEVTTIYIDDDECLLVIVQWPDPVTVIVQEEDHGVS